MNNHRSGVRAVRGVADVDEGLMGPPLVASHSPSFLQANRSGSDPLKVLHLSAGNLYGGIETFLTTLARMRHLAPGMEPEFGLCFRGRLWDELVATGVPVHDFGPVRLSRPWTVGGPEGGCARFWRTPDPRWWSSTPPGRIRCSPPWCGGPASGWSISPMGRDRPALAGVVVGPNPSGCGPGQQPVHSWIG